MLKSNIYNPYIKYLALSIILISISEVTNEILGVKELLYRSLSDKLTNTQIKTLFEFQDKWFWFGILVVPILLLIKTILVTGILYIGNFFFNKKPIYFKELWSIIINSEFIFLLLPICKIIWFCFFQTNYTLEDFQYFYPLSALNIIGYKGLESWLVYPLQVLNFFELAYVISLAYQIGNLTKTNADIGLKIVASSYIPALFLWVTIVMFFTLNFS